MQQAGRKRLLLPVGFVEFEGYHKKMALLTMKC